MQLWLLALALALVLLQQPLPPLPLLPGLLAGLLWRPEGSAGLFLCGGLLSDWVQKTGLQAVRHLPSA